MEGCPAWSSVLWQIGICCLNLSLAHPMTPPCCVLILFCFVFVIKPGYPAVAQSMTPSDVSSDNTNVLSRDFKQNESYGLGNVETWNA